MTRLAVLIATAGGAGFFPIAPGTVGSAVGIVVFLLTRHWSPVNQVVLLVAIVVSGTWAATTAARHLQREDPGPVVVDEVAGQLLTLLLLDVGWIGITVGFFLFRLLDILKPFPARRLEALPEGVGIMADDLMVAVYGWILMRGFVSVWPGV